MLMASRRAGRVSWLMLVLGLELSAGAVLGLRALDAVVNLPLPWWAPLAAPPLVYALLGLVGARPFSLRRGAVAAAVMCALYAVLVAVAVGVRATLDLVVYDAAVTASLGGSPTETLLRLVAVPLMLAPLRPRLARRRSSSGVARPALARPREGAASSAPPRVVAAAAAPVAPPPPAAPPAPATVPPRPKPAAVGGPRAAPPVRVERAPSAAAEPPAPAPGAAEETIRIPFVRIADQLPAEMFLLTRSRAGAGLRGEAGTLFVPQRLVLPQLGEGRVRVKWEAIADQFPREQLKLSDEAIASRLPDASIVLPLDEVVRQVRPELLALSSPAADVFGIEEFAPPFQPHVPPPSATTDGRRSAEPAEPAPAERQVESPGPARDEREEAAEEPLEPAAAALAAPPPAPARETPAPAPAAAGGRKGEARRFGAVLASLMSSLEIGERDGTGTTVFTAIAPTLHEDAVVQAAMRAVPFLADERLPTPAAQATLRGADATIVLTPLGAPDAGGPLLVTAVASGGSLALLERLSLRAAGEARIAAEGGARPERAGRPPDAADLRATLVPPSVRAVADSLTAFGPVAPTMLRDATGSLRACLFLPSSVEAEPLAQFARDLHRALEGSEIGPVSSIILRLGTHRVILETLEVAPGGVTLLVGGGPVDRPGLARLELGRAATRLGVVLRG
jgi:hypothetical protein